MPTKLGNKVETTIDYKEAVKAVYPEAIITEDRTGYQSTTKEYYVVDKTGGKRLSHLTALDSENAWRYAYESLNVQ